MQSPITVQDFERITGEIRSAATFRMAGLWALGGQVWTGSPKPILASARFPVVNGPGQNLGSLAVLHAAFGLGNLAGESIVTVTPTVEQLEHALRMFAPFEGDGKTHANIDAIKAALAAAKAGRPITFTAIYQDVDPVGVEDSTLKLYGLSWRHFKPNQLNLNRIFTKLPNVAWVGDRPMDADEVDTAIMAAAFEGKPFSPHMIDKFPLYAHRINGLSMGVRITDQNKVRLGAYLGEGTTLMPGASYINFNAGTDGGMIEGRISSSAFVGKGSDIGGGASILGTLSGGNSVPISVGRNCLLEVNCALGIPVGDAVIISAECAVMASTKVLVRIEGHPLVGQWVKAAELAGINAVTFRQNSQTGQMEVVRTQRNIDFANKLEDGQTILNLDLHCN